MRRIERHLGVDPDDEILRGLHASDLWLATACEAGNPNAIAACERATFGEIDAAAARVNATPTLVGEVKQILRRALFVAEPGRAAAIASFAGRGDLRGWVRVTATREFVQIMAREKREVHAPEGFLDALAPAHDPELAMMKEMYQSALRDAFRAGLVKLGTRERTLLRFHLQDGLTVDEIGALYGVHRATAARWLQKLREEIFGHTRDELQERIGAGDDEVDSIIRLVQSRLDVSFELALRSTVASDS